MKPTVLKWNEYLNCILPIFVETVEVNFQLEKILEVEKALKFISLRKLYINTDFIRNMDPLRDQLTFLNNFKSTRWITLKNKLEEMILINNDVGLNGYKTFDEFFLHILEKLINLFKTNAKITDLNQIPNFKKKLSTLKSISLRNSLENARKNFANYIPTLVHMINIVGEQYLNAELKEEIDTFLENFSKLMKIKVNFKEKFFTMNSAFEIFASAFVDETNVKRNAAKSLFNYFH